MSVAKFMTFSVCDLLHRGDATTKRRGGKRQRKIKIRQAHEEAMEKWLEEAPDLTLRNISDKLKLHFDIDVTAQCVAKHLDGLCFSVKQSRNEAVNVNSNETKNKRQAYATQYMAKLDDGFVPVFQDETNFNMFCKRSNGRSKTGTRVHIVQPNSKGPNLHCIGAITQHSLVMLQTRRGSLKAENFYGYLSTIVDNCLGRGIRKLLVVIDNAPAHSRAEDQLQQKLQTLDPTTFDAVELLRLSPYSPSLNPIENFWSKFKAEVKNEMRRRRSEITDNDIGREPGESIVNKRLRIMEDIARQSADVTAAASDIGQYINHMHFFHLPRAANGSDMLLGE